MIVALVGGALGNRPPFGMGRRFLSLRVLLVAVHASVPFVSGRGMGRAQAPEATDDAAERQAGHGDEQEDADSSHAREYTVSGLPGVVSWSINRREGCGA